MRTEEPRAVRLKDYRPFDYRILKLALDFSLDPEATRAMREAFARNPALVVIHMYHRIHLRIIRLLHQRRMKMPRVQRDQANRKRPPLHRRFTTTNQQKNNPK